MEMPQSERIMLIGNNGAGKSYFAKRLAAITGLPLFHLDSFYWKPDWSRMPRQEFAQLHARLIAGEKWIIDGNNNATIEQRMQRAQLLIFLDYATPVCLAGAIGRLGKAREDMPQMQRPAGPDFLPFLKAIALFRLQRRPAFLQHMQAHPEVQVLRIKSRRGANRLLAAWEQARQ